MSEEFRPVQGRTNADSNSFEYIALNALWSESAQQGAVFHPARPDHFLTFLEAEYAARLNVIAGAREWNHAARAELAEFIEKFEAELPEHEVHLASLALEQARSVSLARRNINRGNAQRAAYWTFRATWCWNRAMRKSEEQRHEMSGDIGRAFFAEKGAMGGRRVRRSPEEDEVWLSKFETLKKSKPRINATGHYKTIGMSCKPPLGARAIQEGCSRARRRRTKNRRS